MKLAYTALFIGILLTAISIVIPTNSKNYVTIENNPRIVGPSLRPEKDLQDDDYLYVCTTDIHAEITGWPFGIKTSEGSSSCPTTNVYPLGIILNVFIYSLSVYVTVKFIR